MSHSRRAAADPPAPCFPGSFGVVVVVVPSCPSPGGGVAGVGPARGWDCGRRQEPHFVELPARVADLCAQARPCGFFVFARLSLKVFHTAHIDRDLPLRAQSDDAALSSGFHPAKECTHCLSGRGSWSSFSIFPTEVLLPAACSTNSFEVLRDEQVPSHSLFDRCWGFPHRACRESRSRTHSCSGSVKFHLTQYGKPVKPLLQRVPERALKFRSKLPVPRTLIVPLGCFYFRAREYQEISVAERVRAPTCGV